MNRFQVRGRLQEAGGMVTAAFGKVIGSRKLRQAGDQQLASGRALSRFGDRKEDSRRVSEALI